MDTSEAIKTGGHQYEQDAFGNLSSTRKLRRIVVYFTLLIIFCMVTPIAVRLGIDGLSGVSMHWSILAFLLGIVLILFTAAFAPAAFSQSKEWMAFVQTFKK